MNKIISGRMSNNLIRYIYIHIPFCHRKCGYCSFYSLPYSTESKEEYLETLQQEISLYLDQYAVMPYTIYFGGGTPSVLNAREINAILDKFDLSENPEISLEVNPITITREFVSELKQTKVNRISMGVQSFIDSELKLLGRLHDSKQVDKAFELLHAAGYDNISLDLIYGLPNQKLADLQISLDRLIALNPEHISTYCLSLDADAPLYNLLDQIPNDEIVSEFYFEIRNRLISEGYDHYEISNFAKPDYKSRHNSSYWNDSNYLGLGAGASGYLDDQRYTNNQLPQYYQDIRNAKVLVNSEFISMEDKKKEYIFLHLRTADGIMSTDYYDKFFSDFFAEFSSIIEKYSKFFIIESDRIALQPEAYFISNSILSEFM